MFDRPQTSEENVFEKQLQVCEEAKAKYRIGNRGRN